MIREFGEKLTNFLAFKGFKSDHELARAAAAARGSGKVVGHIDISGRFIQVEKSNKVIFKPKQVRNPKEIADAINKIREIYGEDCEFKETCGIRSAKENAKMKGVNNSDHVVAPAEVGKKGAIDGHWFNKNGKNIDLDVYEKLKENEIYIEDGYNIVYHPGNSAHKKHFHLGWKSTRKYTTYVIESKPNVYIKQKIVKQK